MCIFCFVIDGFVIRGLKFYLGGFFVIGYVIFEVRIICWNIYDGIYPRIFIVKVEERLFWKIMGKILEYYNRILGIRAILIYDPFLYHFYTGQYLFLRIHQNYKNFLYFISQD
jgi:hypothetical protein